MTTPRWRAVFDVSSTIIMVAVAAALFWEIRSAKSPRVEGARAVPPVPAQPISIASAPTLGDAAAKVVLVEYSDFQCPFCAGMATKIVPELVKQYVGTGRLLIVFKNFPLPIHPAATMRAAAAMCAAEQGRFWRMHDRFFAQPSEAAQTDLRAMATDVGLNVTEFDSCRNGNSAARRVEQDRIEGESLGITGTPTLFLGHMETATAVRVTNVVVGSKPIAELKRLIDSLLP